MFLLIFDKFLYALFPSLDDGCQILTLLRLRVVYKYTWSIVFSLFWPNLRRHLHMRTSQSKLEFHTWRVRNWQPLPFLASRLTSTTPHTISPDDFSIISSYRSSSNNGLLTRESLLISKFKFSLIHTTFFIPVIFCTVWPDTLEFLVLSLYWFAV